MTGLDLSIYFIQLNSDNHLQRNLGEKTHRGQETTSREERKLKNKIQHENVKERKKYSENTIM